MRQWLRKTRVTFSGSGGLVVNPSDESTPDELRVQFSVSRSISGSPNTFSVKVYNLSKGHRLALGKEFDQVMIEAGYSPPEGGGNVGIIAKGRIRDVLHERIPGSSDWVSTVDCGDGDLAFRKATISKTYPKGTPVTEVVEGLYTEMEKQGIDRGEWKFPDDIRKFERPYSMCGSCTREMDTLGRGNKFYWSIQNETLEIVPSDGYLAGVVVINQDSGMIDTPSITDNGVRVKCLLNPELRPGRIVQVDSETLEANSMDNMYRIGQVEFDGDNQEGDFTATIHGESISDGKVDEGVKK